jgi:hypothetical protein
VLRVLTTNGVLICAHTGTTASSYSSQKLVFIANHAALVTNDPAGRSYGDGGSPCPLAQLPCQSTLNPSVGHSALLYINGAPVCLSTIGGPNQPNPGPYRVYDPGEHFVATAR